MFSFVIPKDEERLLKEDRKTVPSQYVRALEQLQVKGQAV